MVWKKRSKLPGGEQQSICNLVALRSLGLLVIHISLFPTAPLGESRPLWELFIVPVVKCSARQMNKCGKQVSAILASMIT